MSSTGSTFVHCGLRMRSELDLPLPRCSGDPDVVITWGAAIRDTEARPPGTVVAEEMDQTRRLYTASDAGSEFLVRFPGCGEFAIAAGLDAVEVRPAEAGTHLQLLPLLMVGAVAAILHELRGSTILHASAVEVDGTAIAFVGHSGQGKSTIAAWLCANGAALVTDDVLLVESDPSPMCAGAASELRLRWSAAAVNGLRADFVRRSTADGRTALAPPRVVADRVPLGAIVLPRPAGGDTDLAVVEVPPVSQLLALLAFPRIVGWSREGVLAQRFDTLGGLVGAAPMYVADIPWRSPFDPSVASDLMALIE